MKFLAALIGLGIPVAAQAYAGENDIHAVTSIQSAGPDLVKGWLHRLEQEDYEDANAIFEKH